MTGHGFQFRKHKFQFWVPNWTPTSTRATKAESEIAFCQNGRSRWKKPKLFFFFFFFWECWSLKSELKLKPDDFNFCYLRKIASNVTELVWRGEATILLGSPMSPVVNHVQKMTRIPRALRQLFGSKTSGCTWSNYWAELSTHVIDCKFKKFFNLL